MPRNLHTLAALLLASATLTSHAQQTPHSPATDDPLPDIVPLMRQVEANQRTSEALQKNYTYRESFELQELNGKNALKKTKTRQADVAWINGVRVDRTVSLDGKPLTPDEQKKESERIDKLVEKARQRRDKADAQGKETDSHGRDEITLSRILELGTFSNPRRILVANRPTILIDYTGDPKAKTRNAAEGVFRELSGTLAVDEQDHVLQHLEARFNNDYKVGGGLVASVKKGTAFEGTFVKINNEVWLPHLFLAHGQFRYLLFFSINGIGRIEDSDYRKFRASSTLLPNYNKVDPNAPPPQP